MSDWSGPLKNLGDAQAYFRAMGCSHFHMLREYPERYAEYRALAISDEVELAWAHAEFDDALREIESGALEPEKLWAKHSSLEQLTVIINELACLKRFCEVTQYLVAIVPGGTRILVAETIVGRAQENQSTGPIRLAVSLGDLTLAARLSDLVSSFCDAASAPERGRPIAERRAAVLKRLNDLRRRLHVDG